MHVSSVCAHVYTHTMLDTCTHACVAAVHITSSAHVCHHLCMHHACANKCHARTFCMHASLLLSLCIYASCATAAARSVHLHCDVRAMSPCDAMKKFVSCRIVASHVRGHMHRNRADWMVIDAMTCIPRCRTCAHSMSCTSTERVVYLGRSHTLDTRFRVTLHRASMQWRSTATCAMQ